MPTTRLQLNTTSGFGSVHGVPRLPHGFLDVFESYFVNVNSIRMHAVVGGAGRPLLLLGGWPQNWFCWRYIMLPLSRSFTVIAVDPRGVGLSDKPIGGYDTDSQASDMLALMDALGYPLFAMVGYDIGEWTAYAMASDHPERVERIVLGEALIPGISPSPPLLSVDRRTSDFLWHHNFNRALEINERLVSGREDIYFGHQFATKAGSPEAVPRYARDFYIEQLRRDPEALRASFEFYRALDQSIPQHQRRKTAGRLRMPILTFAGALACGEIVGTEIRSIADTVESIIIDNSGHYPAEEQPEVLLAALEKFLRPYAANNVSAVRGAL